MKSHSITLQPPRRAGRAVFMPKALLRAESLPCLAFMIVVSALPAAAMIVLATWATNVPVLLPAMQAATGMSALVFLGLALDSKGPGAVLKVLTAIALFAFSYASMAVAAELLVVAVTILAAWLGGGLFAHVRTRCF